MGRGIEDLLPVVEGTVAEERLQKVRDMRQGLLISVVSLLVAVLAARAGASWFIVTIVAFFIGLFALPISFFGLAVDSRIDGETMYGSRLPVASLWNRNRLGAFHAADIIGVEITKEQGYTTGPKGSRGPWIAQSYLVVRPMSGAPARFLVGSSFESSDQAFDISDQAESRRARDWLREHGIPIGREDAASDRRKALRYARQFLVAGLVGVALTGVEIAIVGINVRGVASVFVAGPAILAILGIGGFISSLADGSRISEAGLFSYYIPLRALWVPSQIGFIGPEQVATARVETKKAKRSRTVGPALVLEVRALQGGGARFNSENDAEAFESAVRWVRKHGIPIENFGGA